MGQKRLTGDFASTVIRENRKVDDRKRNMIKHVLFDLDGTLLPMDQSEFVKYYMPLLAKRFVKYGMEPKALIGTIWKGVEAMVLNDGSMTNEDAFWKCFEEISGLSRAEVEQDTLDFYANEFNEAIASTKPNPRADQVVKLLKEHGVKVYLATNPIFPRVGTMNRIRWAGIDAEDFEVITTYETYHYCKPNPKYFQEVMEEFGLDPKECLMVGNDVQEDLTIRLCKDIFINRYTENKKTFLLEEGDRVQRTMEELYEMVSAIFCSQLVFILNIVSIHFVSILLIVLRTKQFSFS